MPTVTVRIDGAEELQAKFEALERAARGATLERAALAGAAVIETEAKNRAPGPYLESEVLQQTDQAIEIGIGPDADHWYYGFFETGTSGHVIEPSSRRALAFEGREGVIVRRKVYHEGMAARPFLRPAIEAGQEQAIAATAAVLRREIEGVI